MDTINELPQKIRKYLESLGYSTEDIISFIDKKEPTLFNPFLLKDMDILVKRIESAYNNKEKIVIYGDYDVDGTMSTTLLYLFLKRTGADVDYYIPHRSEGYGLSKESIDKLYASKKPAVLISVDTGITAHKAISYAKSQYGLDIIITDHHLIPPEGIPQDAYAIINPKREDCESPFDMLAGAGVAFYVVRALNSYLVKKNIIKEEKMIEYAVLSMLATLADVVPLVKDNRDIVKFSLKYLYKTRIKGLNSLLEDIAFFNNKPSARDLSWKLTPVINAAGRLGHAEDAIKLFLEENFIESKVLSANLMKINQERRDITENSFKDFDKMAAVAKEDILVLSGKTNAGISGILAARIAEKYNKPTLIIALNKEGECKGSARAKGYNIKAALDYAAELFSNFGGHKEAAGFSIIEENIDKLRSKLKEYTQKNKVIIEERKTNFNLEDSDLTDTFSGFFSKLEPFGKGLENPYISYKFKMKDVSSHHIRNIKDTHYIIQVHRKLKLLFFNKDKDFIENLKNKTLTIKGELLSENPSQLKVIVEDFTEDIDNE